MDYITRAGWGARAPEGRPGIGDVFGIGVHYTYRPVAAADHALCDDAIRQVQNAHMGKDWIDIAYSWLTCDHGSIYEGRGWGRRTAANGTNWGNEHYHAVCHVTDGMPTELGIRAINTVLYEHGKRYENDIHPHSWFKPTGCPGDQIRGLLASGRIGPNIDAPIPKPPPPHYPTVRAIVNANMPIVREGQDGQHVEDVQYLLRKFNQRVAVDGDFGPATRRAVTNVQAFFKAHGANISVDGVVGPQTWKILLELP